MTNPDHTIRDACIDRLSPESLGRWPDTDHGRRALAEATWESGWDRAEQRAEGLREAVRFWTIPTLAILALDNAGAEEALRVCRAALGETDDDPDHR